MFSFNVYEGNKNSRMNLQWVNKRSFTEIEYYPATLKERYGEEKDGWVNKLYYGDNLQVMSHLLKEYRGKVNLIYIDPPFNSNANYKSKVYLHGVYDTDNSYYEEKQYGDIWEDNDYLQFMYERLVLCRELLSDTGSIYVHCDWHQNSYIRLILDEVFGCRNIRNEIVWCYTGGTDPSTSFAKKHDTILFYSKSPNYSFNTIYAPFSEATIKRFNKEDINGRYKENRLANGKITKTYMKSEGKVEYDYWSFPIVNRTYSEYMDYPTQKPEALLERIIKASSNPGDIVFDCFMGSGTTQSVSMKLGRKFLGADINLGSIQATTKRLINRAKELNKTDITYYTGFEVYHVNECKEDNILNANTSSNIFKDQLNVEIKIETENNQKVLKIVDFKPHYLLSKFELDTNFDFRSFIDSVYIDWDYKNGIFRCCLSDITRNKKQVIEGTYEIPEYASTICVKIIDISGNTTTKQL